MTDTAPLSRIKDKPFSQRSKIEECILLVWEDDGLESTAYKAAAELEALAAPQKQTDGRVVAALIAALKDRPTFGGTPQTAFGREYREWEQSVDAMLLELDGPK